MIKQRFGQIFALYPQTLGGRLLRALDAEATERYLKRKVTPKYSHLMVSLGAEVWADASEKGFRIRIPKRGEFRGDLYELREPLTATERTRLIKWWAAREGMPYGHISLARLVGLALLARVVRIDFDKLRLRGSGWVCSTAVSASIEHAGRDLWPQTHKSVESVHLITESEKLQKVAENWQTPGRKVWEESVVARARRVGAL